MVDNCVTGEEIHQKRSNFAIVDYSCIPAFSVCGQDQVITHMYRLALVWIAIKIEAHVTYILYRLTVVRICAKIKSVLIG